MVETEICNKQNTLNIASIASTLNITSKAVGSQFQYAESERLIYSIVIPIILIFCLSFNGAFLFVVAKIKRLHTITNYYLFCISIADIIFVAISIGAYMWTFFSSPYVKSAPWDHDTGCVIAFAVPLAMYFTSMALITFVTLERYYAICYPLRHMTMAGKRRTVKIIVGTTLVGVILGFLVALKDSKIIFTCIEWPNEDDTFTNFPSVIYACRSLHPNITIMSEVLQTVPFFVAMIWNVYMYVRIIHTLNNRKVAKITDDTSRQVQLEANRVRNQVARLLILNGSVFFACQVSYRVLAIHTILQLTVGMGIFSSSEAVGLVVIISRGFLYLNSSINPILYNVSSSFYYNAFKEAFGCKNRKQTLKEASSTALRATMSTASNMSNVSRDAQENDI